MVTYSAPMPIRPTGPMDDGHIDLILQPIYDAISELRTKGVALTSADLTDSTTTGRAVFGAADAAAARTAIGAGTSSLALGTTAGTAAAGNDSRLSDARTPTAHTHTASQISDSTTVGRSLVTATDAATARAAIGAGTSSLALGTTASTAAAGNDSRLSDARTPTAHNHPASQISDSTTVGRAVMTATDATTGRTALGAAAASHTHVIGDLAATGTKDATTFLRGDGTWAVPVGGSGGTGGVTDHSQLTGRSLADQHPTSAITGLDTALAGKQPAGSYAAAVHTHVAADISNSTTVGRSLVTATDAAAARAAIGAGTSSLVIGTTAGTAAEGTDPRLSDARTPLTHTHTTSQLSDATAFGRTLLGLADAAALRSTAGTAAATGLEAIVMHDGTGTGPARPSGFARVRWVNPVGTTYGRPTNMAAGDVWEHNA